MSEPAPRIPFRIFPGFAVPFAEAELPGAAALNRELKALFLQRAGEGDKWRNPAPTMASIATLFESRFDLFRWPEPCVERLREFCNSAVFRLVGELNGYGPEVLRELRLTADAWFHVARRGQSFGLHNHPMASWSGVYCVDSGYGDDDPETGELVFMPPAMTANMFVDLGVANLPLPWATRPKSYLLRPGQLVLFPSWVLHQVLPYQGPGERITVAFNVWFRRVPSPDA